MRVVFDPSKVSYEELVCTFYEVHDPTQGMRQGNDRGTQYRSAIYMTSPAQEQVARAVTERYQPELTKRGLGSITTEITGSGNCMASSTMGFAGSQMLSPVAAFLRPTIAQMSPA